MAQQEYILMNKRTPVLTCAYDNTRHAPAEIVEVINPALAPLDIFVEHRCATTTADIRAERLATWWNRRAIPASRQHLARALDVLPVSGATELLERNYGLALTDRYWLCPPEGLTWDEVNFFDNDFSEDVGRALMGEISGSEPDDSLSLRSPDGSGDGILRKRWKIIGGKRVLLKAGRDGIVSIEPVNEHIATLLYDRLLNPGEYVRYRLARTQSGAFYSLCENMITPAEELIPALSVREWAYAPANMTPYERFVAGCKHLGVVEIETGLAKMLVCDFILANYDRHYRNFGLIRNIETGETRFAPIFDNGAILFSSANLAHTDPDAFTTDWQAKPFIQDPTAQLGLVSDYSWFDPDALHGFAEEMEAVLQQSDLAALGDAGQARIKALVAGVESRVETVCARARECGTVRLATAECEPGSPPRVRGTV
ncbi:MAG: hypothetical protein LBS17_03490 [Actinomycetes bacterium]|nr:hypothetical protein [Actinomycetes bacterium]